MEQTQQNHEVFKKFLTLYRMAEYAKADLNTMCLEIVRINVEMQNVRCPTKYYQTQSGKAIPRVIPGKSTMAASDNDARLIDLISEKDELVKTLRPEMIAAEVQIMEVRRIMNRMPKEVQYVIREKYALDSSRTYESLAKELHYSRKGLQKMVEKAIIRAMENF